MIGVIRSGDGETEIENTKSHLTKYNFDIDKLYRWLSDENLFYLKHLFAYFSDGMAESKTATQKSNVFQGLLQPRRPQMEVEEDDYPLRSIEDSIKKAFTDFSAQAFSETQGPIVDTYKAPKLNNHYTQIFQQLPEATLKILLSSLEEVWNNIYQKPASSISAQIPLRTVLNLGLIDPNYGTVSYSPQVSNGTSMLF